MRIQMTAAVAMGTAALLVGGCVKTPATATGTTTGTATAAAPVGPPIYEVVSVAGAQNVSGRFLRTNMATGQVTAGWDNSATLNPIPDLTLPAGDYHVYLWKSVDGVYWDAIRMDRVSGRIWNLNGDGISTPFAWVEAK